MQKAVPDYADELRSIPGKKVSGGLPDADWIAQHLKADWTATSLVAQCPAQREESYGECDA